MHTAIAVVFSPIRDEQRILSTAEQQIRRIQKTTLPPLVKSLRIEDYFIQAGRDLDRLAAHKRMIVHSRSVHLRPARGGGQ